MESAAENLCSVIQYYKGPATSKAEVTLPNRYESQNSVRGDIKVNVIQNIRDNVILKTGDVNVHNKEKGENTVDTNFKCIKREKVRESVESTAYGEDKVTSRVKEEVDCKTGQSLEESENFPKKGVKKFLKCESDLESNFKFESKKLKAEISEPVNCKSASSDIKASKCEIDTKDIKSEPVDNELSIKGKKRNLSEVNADNESVSASNASAEDVEGNEEDLESDFDDDEEAGNKPRRRGRCKKNPDIIPSHLSSDMVLGYKILLKFLETPQFSGFHKPFKKSPESVNCKITCLNQIKKKFEENLYEKVSDFVNDVREMLINIYESRNQVAIKKALRLEQILEQRIAQLPNYLRPQCALVLSPEEDNNCHNKIRITKGGGFVSLLLEKTEKKRYEKNREKRKLLAEERKQLKEEQDKDVQEWEKNVLMKNFEEDIKSMWELPAIGHFIHLCADILNIGEVAQFEVERMLLMPQCSDTLDLIMTALLTNSLVRARLDRTPSMPYSIWGPLVRTRVMSWYRMWHRDSRNEQKIFEEIGVEPEFWQILGPDINPLDYYYFHEISLLQRVWVLKTLCDVDFVRKKTVYDNIRAQTLDELNPVQLGLDQQGNRYIQFKQFSGSDIRIYRQSTKLEGNITPSEFIESFEGFECREGPITVDKVFKDIWELPEKPEVKPKKKKVMKRKKMKSFNVKVRVEPIEKKNLRQSARQKQKTYADWSDSDQSDTDLRTLRNKLLKSDTLYRPFSDKEFISLHVFRLPREKLNKPTSKRSSYIGKRSDETCKNDGSSGDKSSKTGSEDRKEDAKQACDDEQSDSLDAKQNSQTDFEKNFHGDDINEDEFDLNGKINNCELDSNDVKFTVKNLENLKMVFKKGSSMAEGESDENLSSALENSKSEDSSRDKEYDALYKYNVPDHLKPDSSKFYLVVDSVEGLRQLISKFGSHENDLEIITRSTKSKKKNQASNNTSCEVQLIEKLQNLLLELEPWELDLMKSSRTNKEKMYKEYMNFMNRPSDFVHPNEAYWMKTYEEPSVTSTTATATTTTTTVTTAESSLSNGDKNNKSVVSTGESDSNQQDANLDMLGLRKRTRVTRVQLQPENDDLDEDFDDADDDESNESDDNWVLPTPKKRAKRETAVRTPKLPRRSSSKKTKSSPCEKTEPPANSGEKTQSSSPEKAKKALFWGPRSTDPSEDLNWETNRQKILEQHNSPIKKLLKQEESKTESENLRQNSQKCERSVQSVIMTSPKRLSATIPGNKKPYFSSAQLKAIEQKGESEDSQLKYVSVKTNTLKPEVKTTGSNTCSVALEDGETAARVQTYTRTKKPVQTVTVSSQSVNRPIQPAVRQTSVLATTPNSQVVRYGPQLCAVTSGVGPEQKAVVQIQIQQPGTRPQKIQIQDLGQNRVITSAGSIRMQQPVQWQQKLISVQPGKIIQQTSVPNQTQLQSQSQIQAQSQEPQKGSAVQQPIQVPAEKLDSFLQMVTSQGQTGNMNPDGDLYITDGKNLMKFDSNFVQQLQKDQIVTLDLKKTLLLVKPKLETSPSTSQSQTQIPTTQQNILVINKASPVQQTVSTTSVPNFVIPTNYIIKDPNQPAQGEQGQQTVKIVQQSPAYVIQKPILNKQMQPQVIKIITSQPMATNQNLILTPVGSQMIQPMNQAVVNAEQQPKQAVRLVRPSMATSVGSNSPQNKISTVQSPIIVNNIVQIQGQRLESPKPQTSVVSGRIVSTGVPSIRMATPQPVASTSQTVSQVKPATSAQSQTVLSSTNINPQVIRSNVIAQPVRLTPVAQNQVQTTSTAASQRQQFVVSTTQAVRMVTTSPCQLQTSASLNQPQTVRFTASPQQSVVTPTPVVRPATLTTQQVRLTTSQPQTVIQTAHPQIIRPAAINTQTVRVVSQPQIIQTQTLVSSSTAPPDVAGSSANISTPTMKIVTPTQYQTQTVVPCVNLNSQTVRLATTMDSQPIRFVHPQPVRLIANNSVGVKFINRNPTPMKATVITSTAQSPLVGVSNVRPAGVVCQPVQYQAIVQSPGVTPVQTRMQLTPTTKTINATTFANSPIIIVEDDEEEVRILGENISEPPVTLDYINGELSVKKTSQGWKYAVKASNGKDIILTDDQIEERLKANNGVMK